MLKMLLIEDNESNADLAKLIISSAGHDCVVAPDGPAGLSLIDKESFDLVLLDIQLPLMDGFEVLKELRKKDANIPVIGVSSYAMRGDAAKALAAGFNGYITKPIRAATFVDDVITLAKRPDSGADSKDGGAHS